MVIKIRVLRSGFTEVKKVFRGKVFSSIKNVLIMRSYRLSVVAVKHHQNEDSWLDVAR